MERRRVEAGMGTALCRAARLGGGGRGYIGFRGIHGRRSTRGATAAGGRLGPALCRVARPADGGRGCIGFRGIYGRGVGCLPDPVRRSSCAPY